MDYGTRVEQSVIVSELAARTLWPEEDALGQQIFIRDNPTPYEVIGVCGEVRYKEDMEPTVYIQLTGIMPFPWRIFIIRTEGKPDGILPFIKNAIWSIAPDHSIDRIYTYTDVINLPGIAKERFYMSFFVFFTFLAFIIAIVGIFGLTYYIVAQKSRDICIRIAVGASSMDILKMVLGKGVFLALSGIGIGLFIFIIFNRVLSSFVYGISPSDVPTMIIVSALMLLVTVIAVLIPSIKAMRLNPNVLLKEE